MNLTSDQQKAVFTRGGKIVIGAAAGSGKTAVLSTRVINYILSGGSIKDLLIVTFTILAAKEMKERIKKNIEDALNKDKENKHLQKELILIEDADIMTMDSFYNKLIKENFHLLKIKPDFKIISEVDLSILERKVVNNLIEKYLIGKNENFIKLLDNFSNPKSGEIIENLIIKFNKFIDDIPFSEKWLSNLYNVYKAKKFNDSVWSSILYKDLNLHLKDYNLLYEDVINDANLEHTLLDKLSPFLNAELNFIMKLIDMVDNLNYDGLIEAIKSYNFVNFPAIRGYADNEVVVKAKNVRSALKKYIEEYKDKIDLFNSAEFENVLSQMEVIINELALITLEYRKKLEEELFKENALTFKLIPQVLLKLLVKDYDHLTGEFVKTDYAEKLEVMYEEILIDEYQDTNLIQDLIFKAISKNDSNLFIVGDVKQSIYGFRSARPDLLNNEKNKASLDNFPMLINLSKNFRSRDYVINFTNYIFSKIMDLNFGSMNYDINEQLNQGASFEPNENAVVELFILNNVESEESENREEDLSKVEKEAKFIASKVNNLLLSNYQVYDNKEKRFRNIKYSDIAILLRNNDNAAYVKALNDLDIPVYTESAPIFFDNYEVKLIISLLEFLDNPYNEIALVSLLRSPIFMFSLDELLEIRLVDVENNLYSNLQKINTEKVNNFKGKVSIWKDYSKLSVDKLLVNLYSDTDLITILSVGKDSEQITKNILEMLVHAEEFVKSGKYLLSDFIQYIKELIDSKVKIEGINPPPNKDSVLITTIHKSKGLEFPIVFLPNLDKRFNIGEIKDDLVLDQDYYLAFKLRNYENYSADSNILLELMKKKINEKALEEEMRVLYVALTRAKEKLILTGTVNKLADKLNKIASLIGNEDKILPSYLLNSNSYMDWILPLIIKHKNENILHNYINVDFKKYYDIVDFKVEVVSNFSEEKFEKVLSLNIENIDFDEIKKYLDFELPNMHRYKESMSVTEIKSKSEFKEPKFINELRGTTVGTIYHKIIEKMPIKMYSDVSFKDELNNLITEGFISKEELSKVDIGKIYNFYKTNIYNEIILRGKNYREHEINFLIPASFVYDEKTEGELLVNGVIDFLCILDEEVYIIDFKSDLASEKELTEKYKKQLDLYEFYFKDREYRKIYKYIYSLHLGKFILL